MGGTRIGNYFLYDVKRQIDESYIGDGKELYISNMDSTVAMTTTTTKYVPGEMGFVVKGATVTTAADILGNTRAVAFGGSSWLQSQNLPKVGDKSFSLSIAVYFADWSTVASDATIFSQMDSAGDNGWRLYLKADETLHLVFRDGGADTLDISSSVAALAAGWHSLGCIVDRGVAQVLYIDGISVDSDTEVADTIGTPTAVTKDVSAINTTTGVITTSAAHGRTSGDIVSITGLVGTMDLHGIDSLNGSSYVITVTDTDKFTLNGIDMHTFGDDAWTSGGVVTYNPPINTEVCSDGGGNNKLTGRIDEIVYQIGGFWDSNIPKLLNNVMLGTPTILDESGVIKSITVS